MVWRAIALLGFGMGAAALAIALMLWDRIGASPPVAVPPAPRAAPARAIELAGRTAELSRVLADRGAVARARLAFAANGTLDASCRAEAADGSESACFGAENGTGVWRLSGARLCLTAAVLNLPADTCYELSGEPPHIALSGPGFLAGNMLLR